ncbi:MAG: hypothetical protein WA063_03535 [Minisyncoccia bacterium]
MQEIMLQILFFLEVLIFLSVIFLQIANGNKGIIILYLAQSLAVSIMLIILSFEENSIGLFMSALVVMGVKVVIAPIFFLRLVSKQKMNFSTTSYLSTPMTLLVIMLIVVLAKSPVFLSLSNISTGLNYAVPIALSSILASLFLTMNKRGAMSQVVGILSLENSIVSFASIIGLKQTFSLELGIIFDIFVWIVIAVVFVSMMYKHFGSLNITEIKHLKD